LASQTAGVSTATGYAAHGDGEAEPWPSELNTLDFGKFLQVSTDKRTVRYTGDGMHNNDVGAIQVRESRSHASPFPFPPLTGKTLGRRTQTHQRDSSRSERRAARTGDGFQNRRNNSLLAPQRLFSSLVFDTVATALYQLGTREGA
jgi:hypothetical protein